MCLKHTLQYKLIKVNTTVVKVSDLYSHQHIFARVCEVSRAVVIVTTPGASH